MQGDIAIASGRLYHIDPLLQGSSPDYLRTFIFTLLHVVYIPVSFYSVDTTIKTTHDYIIIEHAIFGYCYYSMLTHTYIQGKALLCGMIFSVTLLKILLVKPV